MSFARGIVLCGALLLLAVPARANDLCADATPVGCDTTVDGSTVGAGFDDVGFCGTSNTSGGVWYKITGTGGSVTASTCGTADFDTKLSVFTGGCDGLACVGGQDDAAGCPGFTTNYTFPTVAGEDYYILVHGFASGTGTFSLSISCTVPPSGNDGVCSALPLACDETVTDSTITATFDDVGVCGTSNTAPGVWYTFTGDGAAVILSTCNAADFDTKLSVFSGACDALTCVAGVDDAAGCGLTSELSFVTDPGVAYFVLVHGFGSGTGNFDLTRTCPMPPENDDVCMAETLTLGESAAFDNTLATVEPDEVSPGAGSGGMACEATDGWCESDIEVQSSVWYAADVPASGCLDVAAGDFDLQAAVWAVDDCGDFSTFEELGANDDSGPDFTPALTLYCLTPGTTVFVQIDGYGGSVGAGTVTVGDCGLAPLAVDAGECRTHYFGYDGAPDSMTLTATATGGEAPYTFTWSPTDGIVSYPSPAGVAVAPTEDTVYTVFVQDAHGCEVYDDVLVQAVDLNCSTNPRQAKVAVCHIPDDGGPAQDLCIAPSAVPAHLGHHGDWLGPCDNPCR